MTKHLPLVIATLAIVSAQIACAYAVMRPREAVLFVDDVSQIVYDGQVVRADLRRAWVNENAQTETEIIGRVVLTRDAATRLHGDLAQVLSTRRNAAPDI